MVIRFVWMAVFFLGLLVAFLLVGPRFLVYADKLVSHEAVVLFTGPGQKHRLDEAQQLIAGGYARYLIIPDFGIVSQVREDGALEAVAPERWRSDNREKGPLVSVFPGYFESTHVEALEAKRILDRLGLRSALMVSSPYHTRRINLICGRVFSDAYSYAVVPARTQEVFSVRDWLEKEPRKKIASEYVKMVWFLMYEPFNR